ncbi:MAG: DUF1385 domain-containing protein [Chloroflexi bacterium]|nr:DUF1385 domain-containing protein [Chloroflexota bacterium]
MTDRVYYGGQAVIEGVMMRGRKNMVTAVRRPSGGVAVAARPLASIYTGRLRRVPLVRGVIVLIEALVLGIQSLFYSANIALEEEEQELSGGLMWLIMVAALGFAVAVFFLVPLFLTRLLHLSSPILFNLVDGLIRMVMFVAYLKLVSLIPDIRRTFAYHGAEHKTVNAYEAGVPLEVESVRNYSTAHVRCGTSFLFAVLIIAVFVFALVGLPALWMMVLSRIVLVPVIAALGYEVTYFGARHVRNVLVRAMLAPGLLLQTLTTREPDDSQIEVAVTALKRVVETEEGQTVAAPVPVTVDPPATGGP